MFTQEQIREIKEKLALMGSKDTDLPLASLPLIGNEEIALVQGGENKRVSISEFYEEFSQYIDGSERVDFFNVSRYVQRITESQEAVRLTLPEAIEFCPNDVKRAGQVITFMDNNGDWVRWQFTGVSADLWDNPNMNWKSLDDEGEIDFTVTSDVTEIVSGQTSTVTLHFETSDAGLAGKVEIYANGTLVRTYLDVATFNFSTEISETTSFRVKMFQYGYTTEKTIAVKAAYKVWIGCGNAVIDVVNDDHARMITDLDGSYNIEFETPGYLFIVVPEGTVVGPIKMSGFDVPMIAPTQRIIEEASYNVYRTSNKYVIGTHLFIIGEYTGSEGELIQSLQTDVAGLQTLFGEQEEINTEQANSISDLNESVEALEETGANTPDNEDITLVNRQYKFANKAYNVDGFSGLGRVFMRKNPVDIITTEGNTTITTLVNLLTQGMMLNTHTIYVVQYDYFLQDTDTITVPEGCVLLFLGGSIEGGTVIGNNTIVTGIVKSFTSTLSGTWNMLDVASIGDRLLAVEAALEPEPEPEPGL